ncbi:MAG: phosphodiester glycosidase family protein [Schwartzia sp.]|nr:phosphodiester glycosidase family protein [Schwartzia sp. (in: firmicutes)]
MFFCGNFVRRAAGLTLALFFFLSSAVFAAAAPSITSVRFGKGTEHDRIVFDVSALPKYTTRTEKDGARIILELTGIGDTSGVKPVMSSDSIRRVSFTKLKNSVVVTIDLEEAAEFEVKTLKNPNRIFIDIKKLYENEQRTEPAPGLVQTIYTRRDGRGRFRAYLLDVDLAKYNLVPVLANGEVLGRTTVSRMSDEVNSAAAVNASYFAASGEILGMLRMDGEIAGTTYFTRSALGVRKNGTPFVAPVYYSGKVTIGKASWFVSGVNAERGTDALVLYNRAYDVRTNTNNFGREFVVQGGKVVKINQGNSPIPEDGYVVSVHGKARDAFVRVRVGDKVTLEEDLGAAFTDVPVIVGAGPTLVKNGKVEVTAEEEEFPDDIARGRAPRTGVAVLPNRHALLAVVDGRQWSSIGATLTEFAELFVKYGAKEAVNFDGGGSSAMVVGGKLLNSPSDGEERRVGSALAVLPKKEDASAKTKRKK